MKVIKRNGTIQDFDINKIKKAVIAAYKSEGLKAPEPVLNEIDYIFTRDITFSPVGVEEIQDSVEHILMDLATYRVAKAYILYREKHKVLRKFSQRKKEFIENYKQSDNTANATIDDNSNVGNHNVAVLNAELHKEDNQVINFRLWRDKLEELYPGFDYKQFDKDINSICYPHDSSSQVGMPYTYSCKEVIEVMYGDKHWMLPFDLLYDLVEADEILVDDKKLVYQKSPKCLYVKDYKNAWTRVTKITKKKRHRDLVRVKTAFGEDIVVTDNHPMIVDINNIDNTIEAKDSLGHDQYKAETTIEFKGKRTLDFSTIIPSFIDYNDSYINYTYNTKSVPMKRMLSLNKEFGYIVGFFIGDGGYNNTGHGIDFAQKDKEVLIKINNYLYSVFGIIGNIYKSDKEKWVLSVRNKLIFELFKKHFYIQDKAQNKTIPINILDYNEDFAEGVLAGLVDSDGTIKKEDCTINIRLSSRACILQATALFRYFGYSVGNNIQSLPFSNNTSYKTNYTIWGINATKRDASRDLELSFKTRQLLCDSKSKSLKYSSVGKATITKVDTIEEESSFLMQNEYIYDITTETHTFACNNIVVHNCVAITIYPFLVNGIKEVGGLSGAPKHLDSFCTMFTNLVFDIAGQFKGAVAIPGWILAMDHFCRKEWGNHYHEKTDTIITSEHCQNPKTIEQQIDQYFQTICYTLMQPTGARGMQACFWNTSIFDKVFYDTMYGDFVFPDGDKPIWESFNWLQKHFLHWLNQERLKCMLTFPVCSVALIYQDGEFLDKEMYDFVCQEYAEGNSFFTYINDSPESLSSCCRLSSKIEKPQFNFTNGQIGESTGSKNVITLNLNRLVQDWAKANSEDGNDLHTFYAPESGFVPYLTEVLERVYKYQIAYNAILDELRESKMLPVYDAGFISMKRQYLTIGINGLNQAAEFLGIECNKNEEYQKFCNTIFGTIKEQNSLHKTKELMFNTEFTPCESAAIKLYNRDKNDGYWVPKDTNLYASYIFKPNDPNISVLDKLYLHGKEFCGDMLDGGSAAHLNLDSHLSKEQYEKIVKYAAEVGCKYFTFNVPNSECDDCHYITKVPIVKCPKCGSHKITLYDRVIGYLTAIKSWSKGRQIEQKTRIYSSNIN